EKLFRALPEKSKDKQVQAHALVGLGLVLQTRAENEPLKPEEADKLRKEAEGLFDRVATKYADVKEAAERAKGELFVVRNLAVGKECPDLEGVDSDGKKFKLSDYKGKVVVLDFWAEW